MKTLSLSLAAALLASAAFAAGYLLGSRASALPGQAARADASPAVATFSGGRLTADELTALIDAQGPLLRPRYADLEAKRRLARDAVRQKLLVQEALAKGYGQDPEVVREHDRALADRYLKKEFEEPESRLSIPEAELQAWFEQHWAEYARPERVRVAELFLAAPANDPLLRKKKQAEALALLQEVKQKSAKDYYAFAALARQRSEDLATRAFGGELPLATREELEKRLGPDVAEAAFKLRGNDVLAEEVLATPRGFYLLKLRAHEGAVDPTFAQFKAALQSRFIAERREKDRERLLEALEQKAGVRFDEQALSAAEPASSPARSAASGPR